MSDEQDRTPGTTQTAENSSAERVGRPFRPGQSGNPGGRPRKLKELEARILDEFGGDVVPLLRSLLDLALPPSSSIPAAKEFLDRVIGKARQRTEITGEDGAQLVDPVSIVEALRRAAGEK